MAQHETARNHERSRMSLLLSDEARDKIGEFAKIYGSYRYDVIEVLALLSDPNDPEFRQKIVDNIDILPESFQKWFAMDQFYRDRGLSGGKKIHAVKAGEGDE